MREVIKTRVTRTPIGTADDDDDDDGDDDARAVENLNVVPAASPSRVRRDASLAPLTRLVLNDDVAVTVDDSPIHSLRITKQTRDRRPGDRLARRLAAAAWARLAATRAAGEAGRARYEKRRRRVVDALARVRVAKDDE